MLSLFIILQASANAALPPSTFPTEDKIAPLPWWERPPPPPPPPEATRPPAEQPYSLGEFDPIDGIILTTWYSDTVDTWTGMIRALLDRDIPTYVCDSPMPRYWAEIELRDAGLDPSRIEWLDCELETVWMRDFGPMFTINEDAELGIGDARYYSERYLDDSFPEQASDWWGVDFYEIPVWMEGGNFYADGQGTCVSTSIVYEWYSEYYPWFTADFVGTIYRNTLGCDETIWLEPLDGEGTGHVDMFFTYVDHENVIVGSFDPEDDVFGSNAALLDRNAERMEAAGYTVHRVPMLPNDDLDGDGYADFHTVINGFFANMAGETPLFIAPSFPVRYPAKNAAALAALRAAMPGVDLVAVPAEVIITVGGALHCVMKSIPSARWPMPCDDPYDFNDDDPRCDGLTGSDDGGTEDGSSSGGSDSAGSDTSDDGAASDGGDSDSGGESTVGDDSGSPYEDDTGLGGGSDEDTTGDGGTSGGGEATGSDGEDSGDGTLGNSDPSGSAAAEDTFDDDDEDTRKGGCTTSPQPSTVHPWTMALLALMLSARRRQE